MKRKIAAILAADAVGYSRLVAVDEEEALARLAAYRSVFSDFVTRFGGRIFNTAGDAILAEFQSAVDAVRCSVDVQESIRARNLAYPPTRQMCFRIGITIGDVVERNGDLLGDGVNIAARLESIAPPGGICISRSVYEAVYNKLSVNFSDAGRKQLKNIPDRVHAYTVQLEPQAAARTASSSTGTPKQSWWIAAAAAIIVAAGIGGFLANQTQRTNPSETVGDSKAETPKEAAPQKDTAAAPPVETPSSDAQSSAKKSGGTAAPALDQAKPFPLPTHDPVAQQAVIKRQLNNCLDGKEPLSTMAACKAVIDYKISTGEQLALIYQKLGRAERDHEDVDDALDSYDESIRLAPIASTYNDRAIAYFDKQRWDKAIADYTEAIRLDPKFGEAFNNRAWTKFTAGNAQSALNDANEAVRLLPNKSYVWDTRGHIQAALNNRAAAIRDFRKALELDPNNKESRSGLKRLGADP